MSTASEGSLGSGRLLQYFGIRILYYLRDSQGLGSSLKFIYISRKR